MDSTECRASSDQGQRGAVHLWVRVGKLFFFFNRKDSIGAAFGDQ